MSQDEDQLNLDAEIFRLHYALGGHVGVGAEGELYRAPDGDMQEGIDRAVRLCIIPPMSAEQWLRFLHHLLACKSIPVVSMIQYMAHNIVSCELEKTKLVKSFGQHRRRHLLPHSLGDAGDMELLLLKKQIARSKRSNLHRHLHVLHAAFMTKDCLVSWGWTTAATITPLPKKVAVSVTRVFGGARRSRVVLCAIFRYCGKLDDACVYDEEEDGCVQALR